MAPREKLANTPVPGKLTAAGSLKTELLTGGTTKASISNGAGTSKWRLTAKTAGPTGNEISVEVFEEAAFLLEGPTKVEVKVTGKNIQVACSGTGVGELETNAESLIKAVNALAAAKALVTADNGTEGKETGAGAVAALGKTFLAGGSTLAELTEAIKPAALTAANQAFRVLIGSEYMLINEVSGAGQNILHILERGIEGTTEVAHAAGTEVFNLLTEGAITTYVDQHRDRLNAVGDYGVDNSGLTAAGNASWEAIKKAYEANARGIRFPAGTYRISDETVDFRKVFTVAGNANFEVVCDTGAIFEGTATLGAKPVVWLDSAGSVINLVTARFGIIKAASVNTAALRLGKVSDSTIEWKGIYGGANSVLVEPGVGFCANNYINGLVTNEAVKWGMNIKSTGVKLAPGFQSNEVHLRQVALAKEGALLLEGEATSFNHFFVGPLEQDAFGIKEASGADFNVYEADYVGVQTGAKYFVGEGPGHSRVIGYFEGPVTLTAPYYLVNTAIAQGRYVAATITYSAEVGKTQLTGMVVTEAQFKKMAVGQELKGPAIAAGTTIVEPFNQTLVVVEKKMNISVAATETKAAQTGEVVPGPQLNTLQRNTYERPAEVHLFGGEKVSLVIAGFELGEVATPFSFDVIPFESFEIKATKAPQVLWRLRGG